MPTPNQKLFRDMVLGTLIYSVVLGFFNDYTNLIQIKSYSTTFALAVLLQALTLLKFAVKRQAVKPFKDKPGRSSLMATAFIIWLVLFLSKFVFLAIIGAAFPSTVRISGFIGLIAVIATMLVLQRLVELAYDRLGPSKL